MGAIFDVHDAIVSFIWPAEVEGTEEDGVEAVADGLEAYGAWGEVHPTYRAYARAVGFYVDACAPRQPNAKGKAEAKVRLTRLRLDPGGRRYDSLEQLQDETDQRLER